MRVIESPLPRLPQLVSRLFLIAGWLIAISGASPGLAEENSWTLSSPDNQITITLRHAPAPGNGGLTYTVQLAGHPVLSESPLGLELEEMNLASGLRFVSKDPVRVLRETYELPHGKKRECRNPGHALLLRFVNPQGQPLELEFRAYNDGVAFRYHVTGSSPAPRRLKTELSGFALPEGARLWCAPSDKASTYSPGYETYYQSEVPASVVAEHGLGWSLPMLFRNAQQNAWALITESNLGPGFCGSRLASQATNGIFRIAFPGPLEGNAQGRPEPSSPLPWLMPWRVVILGHSLAAIVESTLVTDLAEPTRVQDASWIRPGRVAWSWWSDQPSPRNAETQKKFVDLAAEMDWEYVLVDANWPIMETGNIQEVLRHARDKGVGVLLWYNSGGPHNIVTEKPRDSLTYGPVREFELKLLKEWGVKGIKVDFFQSDKQPVIGLYQDLMKDAAAHQIMVNFHGCTLPRGWERTYPNLMSMEAVRGEECYIFDPKYPEQAPFQNTILPFTRNVVGPMDYTPVAFTDNRYPHRTTAAHELALAVLFESAWLHFADKPEAYRALPDAPKQFLKTVPARWDDTRFVAGYPGKYAVLARRNGNTWYVAGVNGPSPSQEVRSGPLPWLGSDSYRVTLIRDGFQPREFQSETKPFSKETGLQLTLPANGGFVAILKPGA